MFDGVLQALGPQLTQAGALIAFLAVVAATVVTTWIRARNQQLRIAVGASDASAVAAVLSRRFNLRTEKLTKDQTFELAKVTLSNEHSRFKYLVGLVVVLVVALVPLVAAAILGQPGEEPEDPFAGWCAEPPSETAARDEGAPPCNGPGHESTVTVHMPASRPDAFHLAAPGIQLFSDTCDGEEGAIVSCSELDGDEASFTVVRCGESDDPISPRLRLRLDEQTRDLPRCT